MCNISYRLLQSTLDGFPRASLKCRANGMFSYMFDTAYLLHAEVSDHLFSGNETFKTLLLHNTFSLSNLVISYVCLHLRTLSALKQLIS